MNAYEEKQELKRERLEARAARLQKEGQARIARAREISSHIPLGQPILVGHHSEGRHRADLKRIEGGYIQGYHALKAAEAIQARADNIGRGGISSDDPEAIAKLQAELAQKAERQVLMKAANAAIKKHFHKGPGREELAPIIATLQGLGCTEREAADLVKEGRFGGLGFAPFQMTNNNANMARIKKRIEVLEANAQRAPAPEITREDGIRVVENVEENRLQLFFPGKPEDAMRRDLKSAGFRWAPSAGAWQRQLNNAARYAASRILGA